jgi:hypothetical protein
MISKWLFSGAALLELGSWASAVSDLPAHQAALLYASAHGLGSAMLTAGIWLLLPRRYRFPLPWSPLFIFSLSFFIPLIGMIGVALGSDGGARAAVPPTGAHARTDVQRWRPAGRAAPRAGPGPAPDGDLRHAAHAQQGSHPDSQAGPARPLR